MIAKKPLVSIIVPIYNVEHYLVECLESLERQSLNNIEVIMINDGSTDCSEDIAEDFASRNENFVLISQENGGLSSARNAGLELARGEYLYFLDSDDFLADDAIEKLYNLSKLRDLDLLRFSAFSFVDCQKDETLSLSEDDYSYLGEYKEVDNGIDFYKKSIYNNDYHPSCCLIFMKKEIIDTNQLRFVKGILFEDNLFNFQVTVLSKKVGVLKEALYYRRIRNGSITRDKNNIKKIMSVCVSVEELNKFCLNNPSIPKEICDFQMKIFSDILIWQWQQLENDKQRNTEVRGYVGRIKRLAKKHNSKFGVAMRIFYLNEGLFKLYIFFRGGGRC